MSRELQGQLAEFSRRNVGVEMKHRACSERKDVKQRTGILSDGKQSPRPLTQKEDSH